MAEAQYVRGLLGAPGHPQCRVRSRGRRRQDRNEPAPSTWNPRTVAVSADMASGTTRGAGGLRAATRRRWLDRRSHRRAEASRSVQPDLRPPRREVDTAAHQAARRPAPHASIPLNAGVRVKLVSERLGYSSPAFTMTVYQHVLPGMQADAAVMFSDAVFGAAPPQP